MLVKLISIILSCIYSVTSPVIYVQEYASALRPLSVKCSSAGDNLSGEIGKKFDIPPPNASPETWEECINSVKSKDEFAALKEAFDALVKDKKLTGAKKEKVAGSFTLAEFYVKQNKSPKPPHDKFEDVEPAAAVAKSDTKEPGPTKKAAADSAPAPKPISDDELRDLDIPVNNIIFKKSNSLGHTVIVTKVDRNIELFVVKPDGDYLAKGALFASDMKSRFFIYGSEGKLYRFRFEDSQISKIMEPGATLTIHGVFLSHDRNRFVVYFKENNIGKANIYNITAEYITTPYRESTSVGEPTEIVFSENDKLVTFKYAERADIIVDIEVWNLVTVQLPENPKGYELPLPGSTLDTWRNIANRVVNLEHAQLFEKALRETKDLDASQKALVILTLTNRRKLLGEAGELAPTGAGIQVGQPVSAQPAAAAVDVEALKQRVAELGAQDDIAKFQECAELAKKAKDIQLLEDIRTKFEKVKSGVVIQSTIDKFTDDIKQMEKELEAGPQAAAETGEIELAPETPDIGLALEGAQPAGPAEAEASAEKLTDFLKKAMEDFRSAKTEKAVDSVLEKHMKDSVVTQIGGLKEELADMAAKRKEEVKMLHTLSEHFDSAFDSAVSIGKSKDKHTSDWLKEARSAFYNGMDRIPNEVVGEGRFRAEEARQTIFYREVTALKTQMYRLYEIWYDIIYNAVNAKTFSALDELDKKLKDKFGKSPVRMKAPRAYIDRRRNTLTERQDAAIAKIKLIAADVCDEYIDLDGAFVDYNNGVTALKTAAVEKTKFEDLPAAAKAAEDIVIIKEKHGIRTEKIKKSPLSPRKIKVLKEPLITVVEARTKLIKHLKRYAAVREDIYHKFKPGDLALTQEKFDAKIDDIILETLEEKLRHMEQNITDQAAITERYKRYQQPAELEKLIRSRDERYFKPLCKKLNIEFELMKKDILVMDEAKIKEYLQSPAPVSAQSVLAESRVLAAIGTQA